LPDGAQRVRPAGGDREPEASDGGEGRGDLRSLLHLPGGGGRGAAQGPGRDQAARVRAEGLTRSAEMDNRFEGKGVLVTGGAAGMGRAIAEAFANEGADIFIADINHDRVAATAEEIASGGANCWHHGVDVTDPEQVDEMVAQANEQLGGIDI